MATILVAKVENPSRFGIVVHEEKGGKVSQFVEKPKKFVGNFINAGLTIFDTSVIDRIPLKKISVEREVYPSLAEEG